jgi:hypothetical protein
MGSSRRVEERTTSLFYIDSDVSSVPNRGLAHTAVLVGRRLTLTVGATETTGGDSGTMRKIVGAIVYRVVQIILLPFAAVGYVVFVIT